MFFPGFKLMARETGGSTRLRSASPLLVRYARARQDIALPLAGATRVT